MSKSAYSTRSLFQVSPGESGQLYSLPELKKKGLCNNLSRLPVSIRIILESLLRNFDGHHIQEEHIQQLANWKPQEARVHEIPFIVARVVLQDFTGIPLLADLAAMRHAAHTLGKNPQIVEPLVPVDLVIDHSVIIDYYGTPDALRQNMEKEFQRNNERYQFMKWGMQAFKTLSVVPPGIGIVHQINLEYLFSGVHQKEDVYYPDTLVGTDSHTTMINGVGVVGWGVGGIEAEASMLGQPLCLLTPDVVGVELQGHLREGVTATDLVLTITELLRTEKVVGKFVEYFGAGTASLSVTDRATLSNMAPEYGATMGFFPVDEKTIEYMQLTGKTPAQCKAFESYFRAQQLFGIPMSQEIDYTKVLVLNLDTIQPSLAGPKRPQDRIVLSEAGRVFRQCFVQPLDKNGFNKPAVELEQTFATKKEDIALRHGDVLIAAITSCTNTSNPNVMVAAGLLAKKAVELGLSVKPYIKTSLAPGSRIVAHYLQKSGLQEFLNQLGFFVAGFGCTTCIGNAGDLVPEFLETIVEKDLIVAAVLSGNRNFEARIHPNIKANFLMSPPLVVAFAIAGNIDIDMDKQPLSTNKAGRPIFLRDIWPNSTEIQAVIKQSINSQIFKDLNKDFTTGHDLWNAIPAPTGQLYDWPASTYVARPPFFDKGPLTTRPAQNICDAKALLVLGDSVTTDHISPAGSFKKSAVAGQWLLSQGVEESDFNSYGARRGNHEVMVRGTFANVRIKNLMLPLTADGKRIEGGWTLYNGKQVSIYDAAMAHIQQETPIVIFAGEEYGTGSSRDWAAKGTHLLGVQAVIARSFERIHRSNLVGMGVLPLQFMGNDSIESLKISGFESYDILGMKEELIPQQTLTLRIKRENGESQEVKVLSRIDTVTEISYYQYGGILPYVLLKLIENAA